MSNYPFTLIRVSDGVAVSVGHSGSRAQVEAQLTNVPEGHEVLPYVEGKLGWIWDGFAFTEPPPPEITVEMVKAEQARRLRYTDGYVSRASDPTDGRPVPEAVLVARRAIRDGATYLESMDPIPPDYRDGKYWQNLTD